jgi:hypothetical protein
MNVPRFVFHALASYQMSVSLCKTVCTPIQINITINTSNPTESQAHKGQVTHHHDQEITSVSFNTRNTKNKANIGVTPV